MDPREFIVGVILGFGFLAVFIVAFVGVPFWEYLTRGKVTIFPRYGTYYIVLTGKKALWAIVIRFALLSGLVDFVLSMSLFNRIAWEGILVIFVSAFWGVFVTRGAKRVPRKSIFN